MPRYFFNIRYEPDTIDEDGEELPDDKTAWKEATVIAGEMFRDIDGKLQPGQEWSLGSDRRPQATALQDHRLRQAIRAEPVAHVLAGRCHLVICAYRTLARQHASLAPVTRDTAGGDP